MTSWGEIRFLKEKLGAKKMPDGDEGQVGGREGQGCWGCGTETRHPLLPLQFWLGMQRYS